MARRQNDDLLMEDELAAAFLNDEPETPAQSSATTSSLSEDSWEDEADDLMGQLAVDVLETEESLVIKARTAGVDRNDLDVSISDGILTISGTLSSGDETDTKKWHVQECYWGEFRRTLALPVPVKEDAAKAELKDGVLTISFEKIKQEKAIVIPIS